jgi:hypothetical protein
VAKPAEKKEPKRQGNDKIKQRSNDPALDQLPQAWNKKAHKCGKEIVGRRVTHLLKFQIEVLVDPSETAGFQQTTNLVHQLLQINRLG